MCGKVKKSKEHVHNVERHGGSGGVTYCEMKVTMVYSGDATKRQVSEAVQSQHAQGAVINRQDEWRHVKLPCIQLSLSQWKPRGPASIL